MVLPGWGGRGQCSGDNLKKQTNKKKKLLRESPGAPKQKNLGHEVLNPSSFIMTTNTQPGSKN